MLLQCTKLGDALEIRNGITFDFYSGLPHIYFYSGLPYIYISIQDCHIYISKNAQERNNAMRETSLQSLINDIQLHFFCGCVSYVSVSCDDDHVSDDGANMTVI